MLRLAHFLLFLTAFSAFALVLAADCPDADDGGWRGENEDMGAGASCRLCSVAAQADDCDYLSLELFKYPGNVQSAFGTWSSECKSVANGKPETRGDSVYAEVACRGPTGLDLGCTVYSSLDAKNPSAWILTTP
ncbi:hypothetical protein IE81DRAFT_350574 [Ceraceosorus guamensis]|uniref:Uncharacterized protein n=1 Tax=Ceraceosorus guamensis TaxID=1522189 RepID=A0A316VN45_9BASI|nr:hypothetical protein IE81DRAFT_350574 [Ceraceosorus guamensis]PWN38986.1 hypothetical protein IE81DRAFT_350574 [Ceraceosorus guamensis]